MGLSDVMVRLFVVSRVITDAAGITDGVLTERLFSVAESMGLSDAVTAWADYLRSQDDSVALTDAMARISAILRTQDDTVGIDDNMTSQLGDLVRAVWAFLILKKKH